MFFTGAGVGLVLLVLTWIALNGMMIWMKRVEKGLREKEAQLVHAGRLTAMGEMAAGIAHEINQPLSIIRVASDGLKSFFKREAPGTMEDEAVHSIIGQVERAAGIIGNMRSFTRAGQDSPKAVNLAEPVNAALSFFKEQFRIHGIDLKVSISNDLPLVRVNPQKFEQIVVNFLSNARHAVDKKSEGSKKEYRKEVCVLLERDADGLVFEVRDNGTGMEPEIQERCMEPFYTTKKVGEGTGIGLSIVNSIAREYDMDMKIKSAKGEGSAFLLKIK